MLEREESSQVPCALGLIGSSASVERCCGHEPVRALSVPYEALPPPFIDQGGESYTCRISMGCHLFPRSEGEQLDFPVAEHWGARCQAWASSLCVL